MVTEDKQLEILHDHYKETFARVREVEAARDRLFLWIIGLFALLSLEVGYPATINRSLGKIGVLGAELNLQALPLPALLNVTWVLTLTIGLRYFQTTIWVNRQYDYVHMLERNISPLLRGDQGQGADGMEVTPLLEADVYHREGTFYLKKYPVILNVVWFSYILLFPLILALATISLICWEWKRLPYPVVNCLFDSGIALTLLMLLFFYQVQPYIAEKLQERKKVKEQQSVETQPPTGPTS